MGFELFLKVPVIIIIRLAEYNAFGPISIFIFINFGGGHKV